MPPGCHDGPALAEVNGAPGIVLRDADGIRTVIAFTVDHNRITAIDIVRNPEKLTQVPARSEPRVARPLVNLAPSALVVGIPASSAPWKFYDGLPLVATVRRLSR